MIKTTKNWIPTRDLIDNTPKGWDEWLTGGTDGVYEDISDSVNYNVRTTREEGGVESYDVTDLEIIYKGEGWYYKGQKELYKSFKSKIESGDYIKY